MPRKPKPKKQKYIECIFCKKQITNCICGYGKTQRDTCKERIWKYPRSIYKGHFCSLECEIGWMDKKIEDKKNNYGRPAVVYVGGKQYAYDPNYMTPEEAYEEFQEKLNKQL